MPPAQKTPKALQPGRLPRTHCTKERPKLWRRVIRRNIVAGCFVSEEDLATIAADLSFSDAKLIGGRVIGCLQFESWDRERGFLVEAGSSFCFPLMERELMKNGPALALRCVQDLTLNSFVDARYAERRLQTEAAAKARVASLEEQVASLEREKAELTKLCKDRENLTASSQNMVKKAEEEKAELARCLPRHKPRPKRLMGRHLRPKKSATRLGLSSATTAPL